MAADRKALWALVAEDVERMGSASGAVQKTSNARRRAIPSGHAPIMISRWRRGGFRRLFTLLSSGSAAIVVGRGIISML